LLKATQSALVEPPSAIKIISLEFEQK